MDNAPKDRQDEATLIGLVLAGDDSAWGILMRRHQEAVFRLAYLLTGDHFAADDIAQKAFLRAYRALDRFQPDRPMRPWLLSITKNTAYNHHRSSRRYTSALQKAARLDPSLNSVVPSASKQREQQADRNRLWQAVRTLSRLDQEVIYLRYFLEMSEADAAAALQVPIGTVKSRTYRALNRLKVVVQNDFPGLIEDNL
jgi:RNA polymerase sigma-70 factor (ECF subfamily)